MTDKKASVVIKTSPIFLFFGLLACQHLNFSKSQELPQVSTQSRLPKSFIQTDYTKLPAQITIDPMLMDLKSSSRSHVEVRQGPGTRFPLEDYIFRYGTKFAVLDSLGVWRKVIDIDSLKTGWVHYKVLYPIMDRPKILKIDPKKLPVVVLKSKAFYVRSFKEKQKIFATLPKGACFLVLNRDATQHLIWLPQTNSAVWLDNQFLH